MIKNTMDVIHLNPHHITDIKDLKINGENVTSISENTNGILYVSKDGNDETGNGSQGNPFLTIVHANSVAIGMLNPVYDWEEAVVIRVAPGIYTEHFTESHRRIYIIGNTFDLENWRHDVIIYNTGADEDHYIFDIDIGMNLIGLTVQTDAGGIFGMLPNKTVCSVCQFRQGYFIKNTKSADSFSAYFNYCVFAGDAFKFEGVCNRPKFIAFRHCDIFAGSETIFSCSGTEVNELKFENTKMGNLLSIAGNWSTIIMWSEMYDNGRLTFDTDGWVDIFASTIRNGIHFYSDTSETKKLVNCLFKSTPVGEGDVTADVSIEFIEYSGNHQHNGIDGKIITVSKIKNVGGGQNKYRNIHEALEGSTLQDTIVNLEGDVEIDSPLIIPPNIDIQIDGNKKWKLTSTHATTLCELGLNQQLSFVNMKQILGGKIAALNGNGSTLSFVSCGRYTEPNYVNIEINNGDISAFVYCVKSTIIGTGTPVIKVSDINPWLITDRSFLKGSSGQPAIEWTVDADSKFRCKYTTLIHGSGSTNSPLLNSDPGNGDITISMYNSAMNASFPSADFTNTIVQANNTVDNLIDF